MRLDEVARRFIGVPWKHQGRNPEIALDCIGFVAAAERLLGGNPPDRADYARHPDSERLDDVLRDYFGPPVPMDSMQPGDVVSMRGRGAVRHVGIIGRHPEGHLSLIHASTQQMRVVEQGIDARIERLIVNVYRRSPA